MLVRPVALAALAVAVLTATIASGCLESESDTPAPERIRVFDPNKDGEFSRPPADLVPEEPGELIWVEPLTTPPGIDAWRILYTSESVSGEIVPVSGLLGSPEGSSGIQPLVSLGHGTLGVADECAPTATDAGTQLGLFAIGILNQQGWSAVATDYPGLGTPGLHPYLVGVSEGRAMLDAARAAQALDEAGVGNRVALFGQSQGGHAALFAGELAPEYAPELNLVGVAALAAPSNFGRYLDMGLVPFAPLIALGVGEAYDRDPAAGLDAHDRMLLDRIARECSDQVGALGASFHDQGFYRLGPFEERSWKRLLLEQDPGTRPIEAPVLLLQGGRDLIIPLASTIDLVRQMCAEGDRVQYQLFPQAGHTGGGATNLTRISAGTWLSWLRQRFAGEPAPSNCP